MKKKKVKTREKKVMQEALNKWKMNERKFLTRRKKNRNDRRGGGKKEKKDGIGKRGNYIRRINKMSTEMTDRRRKEERGSGKMKA